MTRWLLLAIFGTLGTLARAGIGALVQRAAGPDFPWGTVCVNLTGAFLFGLVWAATEGASRSADLRFVALTGFMGAYTTFSTFMFDVEQLAEGARFVAAAMDLLLQCSAGLLCIALGLALGRAF